MKFLRTNTEYNDLRRFYAFFRPYRFRAVCAIVFTIAVGSLGGVIPAMLKVFIDGSTGDDKALIELGMYPLLVIAFTVVESLVNLGSNYFTMWVGKHAANDVKLALFRKLIRSDPAVFTNSTSGNILVRYSGDADAASEGLLTNVKTLVSRCVTSLFLVFLMLYYSWIIAIVAVGSLLVTVVPLSIIRKRLKQFINQTVVASAQVTTDYNEAFAGNRVITSYNLYDYAENRLSATLKTIFRLSIKMVQRTNVLSLVMHFATSIGIAATLWLYSYLKESEQITFATFASCLTAMVMLYTPIKKMGNTISTIQACVMAIQRVMAVLDAEPTIVSRPGAHSAPQLRDAIRYENVTFSYEPGRPVLKNINLEVKAGQSVAFVGNSGGGKTTLVNLLPRFYDVESGSVSIDGLDVRDIDLHGLREMIAIVFQDNFLFGGSIRDNIVLGKSDATEEEIAHAVRAACLDEFIETLDRGLDTQIGERGVMLSGGQKQRVAIARAFIKDAPIVILDEATSALDNKSEIVVQQAIENLMANKTVLIIAHRLSTVINADKIVVIKDGEFVESGTHKELMARQDGVYASLYKTQLA